MPKKKPTATEQVTAVLVLTTIICAVAFLPLAILPAAVLVAFRLRRSSAIARNRLTARTNGGRYVSGHPSIAQPRTVIVGTAKDGILIIDDFTGARLGSIPPHAIRRAEVLDRTRIETDSRFTVARVALLGVFALAFPKRTRKVDPQFIVAVTWLAGAVEIPTYFSFSDLREANALASLVLRHVGGPAVMYS